MPWTFYNNNGEALIADGAAVAATQAEMETATATSDAAFVTPGRTHFHPGVAKAWAVWSQGGSQSTTESYNMDAVSDGGATGTTDHLFTTDLSDGNYTIAGDSNAGGIIAHVGGTKATTGFQTQTFTHDGTLGDHGENSLVVFGDL